MNPTVQAFFDDATNTVTYLVNDPATGAAAIIDPVLDYDAESGGTSTASADAVLAAARAQGLEVVWLLETHAHADHLSAGDYLRGLTGAPIGVGDRITEVQSTFAERFGLPVPEAAVFDQLFADGDRFALGSLEVEVLHTPGHTPACISYRIGDAVFVGDTLFMPDFGTARADFPGGDATTLYRSIQRLLSLPPETRVFVGHDYLPKDGRRDFRWETTIGAEREGNVHVGGGATEADFTAMRRARDETLPPPKLLEPALRANIRAGAVG
ncbi:glyoxylase-like metal-dependent hydrolase (beta-lactamase superfamily II) [Brevundimonas alba]|uniref:Glyoxylase-like metal-dependent hydrolase (Beta-lactamase superfamily II) n=1 Tax=Brevundimonas alba TaxID=74314 RepID=A0A7X5YJS1_9CAUL|nr:MBL fold metallo-hydrolase [Brevundimonas alba]NJC41068.1 glyoxylase-like metal-dependent hydrolase (beta-lactamase superfamily II) [Brevundimonas alba]